MVRWAGKRAEGTVAAGGREAARGAAGVLIRLHFISDNRKRKKEISPLRRGAAGAAWVMHGRPAADSISVTPIRYTNKCIWIN